MDKDPMLQPGCPTQIVLDWYGLRDASKYGLEVDYPFPRR